MQVAGDSWNCRIRVLAPDRDRRMKSIPAAVEICPYCKKPFKRLKSHLPHCKMAGDASFAVHSTEISAPVPVTGSSVSPECLDTKKKGQNKSTEMASKKENKKSKPKLIGNERKVKLDSVEPIVVAPVGNLLAARPDEDIQQQIKHSTKKSQKRENGTPRAPGEDLAHTQAAEKELSKTMLLKKSPRVQKSRSRITFDEDKFASAVIQEPLIHSGKATSRSPGQLIKKPSAKQRQAKDSSVQHIPLNEAAIVNQKMRHQPVESLPASADISLATEKQIITGTEDRVLSLEFEGNTWTGKTENAVTTVKASDECFLNTYRTVANVPVQLAAGVKSMMDKNQLSVVSHEESLVYHSPKTNPYPTILQRRSNDEIRNCDLTCLENDIALDSGIIVITRGNSSGTSLKPPSVHMLEMTAAERLSSPKRGLQPGSLGLEWFPELYLNYQNLFSGKQKQQDTRIPTTQVILPYEDRQVPLAERCLMDVKLQDLPAWLATRNPSPGGMLRATCRAWNGYYNRYINVKKGGVAGISMLLLGYCVLSYTWSYEHIKQNRWRKYH
ncbi:PREDICTED: uncharacterized protein C17orf80 homolog [Gekko japonicus]|uniref:Uncharacterized protein C17orf80 homolog n=1 Tax=Gekko japonicus TaxID=146911 RepID=A0ABM1KG45_GEKJA|nr:PREDICTED: uncharacterized protein C17orf80 homolog [Gekko japonicus]